MVSEVKTNVEVIVGFEVDKDYYFFIIREKKIQQEFLTANLYKQTMTNVKLCKKKKVTF